MRPAQLPVLPYARSAPDRNKVRSHAPVKEHCTRSERVQCLLMVCTAPSVTSKNTELPEWRTPKDPKGLAMVPGGGGRAWPGFETTRRAKLAARTASGRAATRTPSRQHATRTPSRRAAAPRHQHAEHAHTTRPGPAAPNSAEDPGLVKQSDQAVHHEGGECFERGLDLALGQRCERCDGIVGPGAREFARLIEHVVGAQAFHDRSEGLVGG